MSKITLTLTVEPELARRIIDLSTQGRTALEEFVENNFDAPLPAQAQQAPTPPPAPPAPSANTPPAPPVAPTAPAPTYTLEALSLAAAPLMQQGKQQELVSLLGSFGVRALTELPTERYGEFATALRGMGAKI